MANTEFVRNQPVVAYYRGRWYIGRVAAVKGQNRYAILPNQPHDFFEADGSDMYSISAAHQDRRAEVRAAACQKPPKSLKSQKPAKQPFVIAQKAAKRAARSA